MSQIYDPPPSYGGPESPSPYAPPNSTMAIVSLVSGILGWSLLPLLGSIVAIVTGHMAKKEIKNSTGQLGGDGLATAGLVLGYSAVVLGICICVAGILFFSVVSTSQFNW
jgi:hypothetical protein